MKTNNPHQQENSVSPLSARFEGNRSQWDLEVVRVTGDLCLPGIPKLGGTVFCPVLSLWKRSALGTGERTSPGPTSGQVGSTSLAVVAHGRQKLQQKKVMCLFYS